MPGATPEPTPVDVFTDPIVQLAALCPLCALAALRPEAALAALSPTLAIFNPAINPKAALLSFSLRLTAGISGRSARQVQRALAGRVNLGVRIQSKLWTWRA